MTGKIDGNTGYVNFMGSFHFGSHIVLMFDQDGITFNKDHIGSLSFAPDGICQTVTLGHLSLITEYVHYLSLTPGHYTRHQ